MDDGLWALRASDLLRRTASSDPTPGGGSVAAVCGALGVGLLEMAVAVSADPSLTGTASRLVVLRSAAAAAADDDVRVFGALVTAHRLPRGGSEDDERRRRAVEEATAAATDGPLALVDVLLEALEVARELEPAVRRSVVSDVQAGRDLALGAAKAALRTADTNIRELERLAPRRATPLRERRDGLVRRLEATA